MFGWPSSCARFDGDRVADQRHFVTLGGGYRLGGERDTALAMRSACAPRSRRSARVSWASDTASEIPRRPPATISLGQVPPGFRPPDRAVRDHRPLRGPAIDALEAAPPLDEPRALLAGRERGVDRPTAYRDEPGQAAQTRHASYRNEIVDGGHLGTSRVSRRPLGTQDHLTSWALETRPERVRYHLRRPCRPQQHQPTSMVIHIVDLTDPQHHGRPDQQARAVVPLDSRVAPLPDWLSP